MKPNKNEIAELLRKREIGASKAAELLGISVWDVHDDLMPKYNIPLITDEEYCIGLLIADEMTLAEATHVLGMPEREAAEHLYKYAEEDLETEGHLEKLREVLMFAENN